MRRLIPTLLIGCLLLLSPRLFAQEVAAHAINASLPIAVEVTTKTSAAGSALLTSPDAKLTNALSRHFPASAQQQWWQHGEGFYVQFVNNEQKARAVFNKKGVLQYAITNCSRTQLPQLLREKMEKEYPGYTLLHAVAITAHNAVAHQAVLENDKNYVTLKATSDEIEAVETKNK